LLEGPWGECLYTPGDWDLVTGDAWLLQLAAAWHAVMREGPLNYDLPAHR
jgi:hypothetical protein